MSRAGQIIAAISRWIDHVASAILSSRESLRPTRFVRLLELKDGSFSLQETSSQKTPAQKGSPPKTSASKSWALRLLTLKNIPRQNRPPKAKMDWTGQAILIGDGRIEPAIAAKLGPLLSRAKVELVLQPGRFVFRPLELPRRAASFLEGIIRAQIDRLTPWSAADAAFGWFPSADIGDERMLVTIAATARNLLKPFATAIAALGVDTITISTIAPAADPGADTIKVFEQKIEGALEARRLRRGLSVLLIALGVICVASVSLALFVGGDLEARRDETNHLIAQRRAALQPGTDANSAAALALERQKHETPSSVIVVEALSRILPDDTYLTELRIQGDKTQIIGITRDPPELIHLIEQSPHFSNATFFAPTTRTPSESGAHFSIEAHIEPVFQSPRVADQ
jgi:general secretion pathway protein L